MSARRSVSLPLPARLLLLSVSFFLFLILNAVGVGAQTTDDHGNDLNNATNLPLGSSVAGRIDPGGDVDVFKLDLSGRVGATDVWIYTTGELDTAGGLYYSSGGQPFASNDDSFISGRPYNFHLRATLAPGIYYVEVFSFDGPTTGRYTLHAEAVVDPGNTVGTAKTLNLSAPTAGSIDFTGDHDYFRLDLATSTHLYLNVRSVQGERVVGFTVDVGDRIVHSNTYLRTDGFVVRDHFGPGTHYIRVFKLFRVGSNPVPYTIHAFEDAGYPAFLEDCQAKTDALNDPQIGDSLYGCQWHLRNQSGEDINVEPVWAEGITGEGINIALVDDGMDFNHEDLRENVNTSLNRNYISLLGSIFNPYLHHGTFMAGIIAAQDNGVGVRGVAPRASIYGHNFLAQPTIFSLVDATTRNRLVTAISNNSWEPRVGPGLTQAAAVWELALESGIATGYGGKGTFYTYEGGSGHQIGDNSNLNEFANFYGVSAVCGTSEIGTRRATSEMGANLWVCAPAGDDGDAQIGIVTTENYDRYIYGLSGTDAATAIVSGVAALIRQANTNLTWRDLKLILAASARKNDPTNPGWEDGARKYGSTSATDLYHFNHEYGFGVVDAKAAVDMAKEWTASLPPLHSSTSTSGSFNSPIPDLPATGVPTTFSHELTLNTDDIDFTEFVEVNVTFSHESFRDLDVELVSPSGARSQLTVAFDTVTPDDPTDEDVVPLNGTFRFGSARHLGEDPNGVWRLNVSDHIQSVTGTWDSWSIKVYGHSGTPVDTTACATGGAEANASTNPGLASDCETLLEARDALVGTGTSLNWSPNTPITSWDGITLEGTPARVTQLALQNRGLRGTLPAQLGQMTALKKIDLNTALRICEDSLCQEIEEHEHNRLTGEIPAALGNLSKLERLAVSRNQLTGPIPPELGNLTGLSQLALGGNQLTGAVPSWLGSLNRLTELYLWGNQLNGTIPSELSNLTDLERLTLSNNLLSGQIPSQLGNLSNLQSLRLHDNQLTGQIPSQLGNLIDLDRLSLANNQLTGTIPAHLGNMTLLRLLRLNGNQLTGEIPTNLGSLSNLEELRLSQNQLTGQIPPSLGDLPNLKELSLWSNQLTGMIPSTIVELANLEKLYLSQNQLTGCIPAALQNIVDNDLDQLGLPFCSLPRVTLSITSTSVLVRINSPIPLTATFSEPVFGFTVEDITVTNGVAGNFVGNDGDSGYTFDVTPNVIGVVAVDIAAAVALDAENNGNTAVIQLSLGIPYDDDHDGAIGGTEVLSGVRDYFLGILTGQQILELVRLYFQSTG